MPHDASRDIYLGKKEKAAKVVASHPVLQVRKVISIPFVPLAVVAGCGKHHLQSAPVRTQSCGCAPCCHEVSHAGSLGSLRVPQQRAPVCICQSCEQIS